MDIVREPIKDTVRDEVDRVFKEITDRIMTDLAEELDYPVGIEYTHYNEKEDA